MATVLDELERLRKDMLGARADFDAELLAGPARADLWRKKNLTREWFLGRMEQHADSLLAAARAARKKRECEMGMCQYADMDSHNDALDNALAPLLAPAGGLKEVGR